ncbi:MAG: hypothetical protein ACRDD1_09410 [Planctomycetia bacterium]
MKTGRTFILTEAAAQVPLVRRILMDVRAERARLSFADRRLERSDLPAREQWRWAGLQSDARKALAELLEEARSLGALVTPGVRCEAWFPFLHRWTGPKGDGRLRPAYFVYNDSQPTICEWFFDGWPDDRRPVAPAWWGIQRRSADRSISA